jgi:hypothetical protein
VRVGDTEFFVAVVDNGPVQVGAKQATLSFDGVRETLHAVASEIATVLRQVRPDEATVEFGLSATAQTGKLTGLVVEGGGQAAFKVAMTWRASTQQPTTEPTESEADAEAPEVPSGE